MLSEIEAMMLIARYEDDTARERGRQLFDHLMFIARGNSDLPAYVPELRQQEGPRPGSLR